ncbi:hypothetical protein PQH03_23215 [Ralstonia insidiosa]|jgi:hypothetical protein|uniref:hypothetical protein n=2 Tax=Ralstonia TaxID=48736 RepID=UPI0010F94911|nr:hypothetical protein [Ralstonia insidiosa]MBA9857777.1 hypothetical protein [Ralstonia insidiosa]MBA9871304.1 hypothetical protein [Ralstonia insidiosa]MBA9937922.1 hypothetical protein [Ralstonia insidiosa]MBX3836908.1 hypothetical protein [Ralstonia insidiosa]MBX3897463.1 hypothetical protein [Ralstonia insidiosa]
MARHQAWPIRSATDRHGARLIVLALVVLGHLALLAWWRDHPTPAERDEPLLQGRLLSIDTSPRPTPPPPARTPARSPQATSPVPMQRSTTSESVPVAPATVDAVEARTLDLSAPATLPPRTRSQAENNLAASTARGTGHAFGPDAASTPRATGAIQESRGTASRWQARVEVGGSAYCLSAQDPSLRRDPFEKALAVPSTCR